MSLRPRGICVKTNDWFALVEDLTGPHEEGAVPARGDDHVGPLDDLVGVLLVPLHYLDLYTSLLQGLGHGHL